MVGQVMCKECEKKCVINIYKQGNDYVYEGSVCDIGKEYCKNHMNSSYRVFTSVVRIKGNGTSNMVPVKSNKPLDINLWIECSKAIGRIYVGLPIKIGDTICKNILNSGVDIICTKNVDRVI